MNSVAAYAYYTGARGVFVLMFLALTGCALSSPPVRPTVYDFGPGRVTAAASTSGELAPLVLPAVEASASLDSTAVLYRLAYADKQQLKAYALARWSMTPAQLVRQRLREQLGERRALLSPGEGTAPGAAAPLILRIQLEEFSQLFETPEQSVGLLRLRATLARASPTGEKLVAQRQLVLQRPAPSADAPGGVRALTAATDAAVQEIEQWLQGLTP